LRAAGGRAYEESMSTNVIDVTEATFETEVIKRSFSNPVVLDLWAEWCGPCKTLGPALEAAVEARDGAVTLAKVDVDSNPRLAQALGVQGIPAVKAVKDGRLVAEFVGVQPSHVVEQWLDQFAPRTAKASAEDDVPPEQAAESHRATLANDPDNVPARAGLARLALDKGNPSEAVDYLTPVAHAPEVAEPLARARLGMESEDAESPLANAAAQALNGAPEAALTTLLDTVRGTSGDERDHARQLMLDVFRVLGDENPLTAKYRRSLSAALF
jgi:putative thioredoxin